jgi:hypothetical protein
MYVGSYLKIIAFRQLVAYTVWFDECVGRQHVRIYLLMHIEPMLQPQYTEQSRATAARMSSYAQ